MKYRGTYFLPQCHARGPFFLHLPLHARCTGGYYGFGDPKCPTPPCKLLSMIIDKGLFYPGSAQVLKPGVIEYKHVHYLPRSTCKEFYKSQNVGASGVFTTNMYYFNSKYSGRKLLSGSRLIVELHEGIGFEIKIDQFSTLIRFSKLWILSYGIHVINSR